MSKTRTDKFLKQNPPERHDWRGKVAFHFGYPRVGWVQWAITSSAYVQSVVIACSNVYDPFASLIQWVEAIADGRLPAQVEIDEEGQGKLLRATPVNETEFILEILAAPLAQDKKPPTLLYTRLEQRQFVQEFVREWEAFISLRYDPQEWEEHKSNLRELDLSRLRGWLGDG